MELFSKADSFGCDKQENQSERQAFGARGNQGEGSLGASFLFCNMVGGSAKG